MPSDSELIGKVKRLRENFSGKGQFDSELDAEEAADAFVASLAPIATDDFTCVMDGGALTTTYEGLEGLRAGWRDFLVGFDTISIHPDPEMHVGGDGECVVEYVHLSGKPRGVDAQIEAQGAGLWRFRGDRLASVEFHLDRERALKAAGVAEP